MTARSPALYGSRMRPRRVTRLRMETLLGDGRRLTYTLTRERDAYGKVIAEHTSDGAMDGVPIGSDELHELLGD